MRNKPSSAYALLFIAAFSYVITGAPSHAQTASQRAAGTDVVFADSALQAEWERWYAYREAELARLDDGFLFSFGVGLSPTLLQMSATGGNRVAFPEVPPYPDINFRGLGGVVDVKVGWLLENDPFLKDYWFGEDRLHDQIYFTFDFMARLTPGPQWRFAMNDSDNVGGFLRPNLLVDVMAGVGTTYIVYPYGVSFSSTVGLGVIALQGRDANVRTGLGPAMNFRIGQEWSFKENWRSGFAVNYGFIYGINPSRQDENGLWSYRESYTSHIFSLQWINSITPPKFRRTPEMFHPE